MTRDPLCQIRRDEGKENAPCLELFDYSNDLNTIETEIDLLTLTERERVSMEVSLMRIIY